MYLVNSPFYALSIATSSLVARSWGERAFDTARRYTGLSLSMAFGLGPLEPLGLYGVAWGTVVARTTGGLLSLATLLSPRVGLGMGARDFALRQSEQFLAIWRLALPAMVDRVLHTGAHVAFMCIVALLGTTALAGHNIALHVESLAFMPVVGVSTAVVALVGQAIGAGLPDIAEKAVKRGILWCFLLMLAIGAVFAVFAPVGVRVFGATPGVIRLAGTALQIAALELPFLSFAIVFSSALRGAGLWFFFRRGAWKGIHEREKRLGAECRGRGPDGSAGSQPVTSGADIRSARSRST